MEGTAGRVIVYHSAQNSALSRIYFGEVNALRIGNDRVSFFVEPYGYFDLPPTENN